MAGAAGYLALARSLTAAAELPMSAHADENRPLPTSPGDLGLPAWGPYSKHLAGTSHLPDFESGVRFDLCAFPGLYRRRQTVPVATSESGFYAWSADPDLRSYTLRYALADLDTLYADIRYELWGKGCLIRAQFVNRTALPQQAALHFLAGVRFPESGPNRRPPVQPATVSLPPSGRWIDGSHYAALTLDENAVLRHLPDNAEIWGEIRADGFVHGIGLGHGFGARAGDSVTYAVPDGIAGDTVAVLRYRMRRGDRVTLRATGAYGGDLALEGNGECQTAVVRSADAAARSFSFESAGGAEVEIDGCALVPAATVPQVTFALSPLDTRATIARRGDTALLLRYASVAGRYGFAWEGNGDVREWLTDDIARDYAFYTHEHVRKVFDLGGSLHYTNVFVRPIFLAPGETKELLAYVAHADDESDLEASLAAFAQPSPALHQASTAAANVPPHTAAGDAYAYGVERLAATVATNVVYPVRRRGRFVRHYTPGRWWDSLYTWDSGFIGLGLLELSPPRSVDNLGAYFTAPNDDCAFIFHGSPLPVQIYQLQALWNRTQDRDLLARLFPGARRMHRFLVGRGDGSRTATLKSGLLRTWDYFYNSGGWDDYPPQAFIRGTKLTATIAPVVNTAHAIRTAKLLAQMAAQLGESGAEFADDIGRFTTALQNHAWNAGSGWFSYVRHDAHGEPVGPLLHESGADFNRGLDGIYPLVSGICTPEQEALFLGRLQDPKVFWTRCGLSTVDQSAPYFRVDGYWNGAVWMPHQWFIWKTLLDLGQGELAARIALTALETWEHEVRATGCCFEHFITATGRGAGWHQFGGLSSPVLSWFGSYFAPGRITGGFDCWVVRQTYIAGSSRAQLRLTGAADKRPVLLAVAPGHSPSDVRWNGASVPAIQRFPDTLEISLPNAAGEGELTIG